MKLIFCMLINIKVFGKLIISFLIEVVFLDADKHKVFHKLILSFLTAVAGVPNVPKIKRLQYLRNDILDYLDFLYMQRPPSHGNNVLYMSIKDYYK